MKLLVGVLKSIRLMGLKRSLASLLVVFCVAVSSASAAAYSDGGDGTVTDVTTGLIWMRCSMGQAWDGNTCVGTANTYHWNEAVALTGNVTFAGRSDWRVPNVRELLTGSSSAVVFPNSPSVGFWSASPDLSRSGYAWNSGNLFGGRYDAFLAVRLVRGGKSGGLLDAGRPTSDYVDGGDGTVTHTPSGLMWKRCAEGQQWDGAACTGMANTYLRDAAAGITATFAGHSDWRVPTVYELQTLIDYTRYVPAINTSVFPDTPASNFWSASRYIDPHYGVAVDFNSGNVTYPGFGSSNPVRLVRGGAPPSSSLTLSVARSGTGTVNSTLAEIDCGSVCAADYAAGTQVILVAEPTAYFMNWGGACSGSAPTCKVAIDAATTVIAAFRNAPVVSLASTAVEFVAQNPGSSGNSEVMLTNTGDAPLALSAVSASGDYAVTHDCGTELPMGAFCTLTIIFTPSAVGTRVGTITIEDDAFDSPQTIKLTGVGQGALAKLSPGELDFPNQAVGTSSAAKTVTLTNTGGAALDISSIAVTLDGFSAETDADFALTTDCGTTLAMGTSCNIDVVFTPAAGGMRRFLLSILTRADTTPYGVRLAGYGSTSATVNIVQGWNLLGNGYDTPLDVPSAFGDATQVLSVWKWIASTSSWAFYTPTLAYGGAAYASSKGYHLLTTVDGGEGFWVNVKKALSAERPQGAAIAAASFRNMPSGWSLIAVGDNSNPFSFNGALTPAGVVTIPEISNFNSLWAWDAVQANWYFFAPSLAWNGTLASYIASKGYLDFSTNTLTPTTGFWVNRP